MVNYELSISGLSGRLEDELKRNLKALLGTRAGTQPADRDFGISWDCLDAVPEAAESLFFLEVTSKVEKYEPRISIKDITFENKEGTIIPHIYFAGKEEM
ncbi:GPW/gp25 family protein [Lacrimispora sp.]|uniref:GPW/gp25 family protein n=1 Tax=Lacrimispora sp. TaxID=2719234 RepID=UPI0032E375C5